MVYQQPQYTIWSRASAENPGSEYTRIDQVQDWQSLDVDLKWGDLSTWKLVLPFKEYIKRWQIPTPTNTLISDGYGLMGIIVFRNGGAWPTATTNGNVLISGVITNASRNWDGSKDTVTVSGASDAYYLKTRLLYPDYTVLPGEDSNYMWNDAYMISIDGDTIETAILAEVKHAMGINATADRGLNYFTVPTSSSRGDVVSGYTARFESLFDMCQELMLLNTSDLTRYGFDIVQTSETDMTTRTLFRFLEPRDMSGSVIFGTDLGTINNFTFDEKAPDFNDVIISGPEWDATTDKAGSDTSQTMYYYGEDAASRAAYGHIEGEVSATGIDTSTATTDSIMAAMEAQATKELSEKAFNRSATITLDPIQSYAFMQNFQLGDYVTLEIGGQRYNDYILEIQASVTPEAGEKITPTVCDPWKFYWAGGVVHKHQREHQRWWRRWHHWMRICGDGTMQAYSDNVGTNCNDYSDNVGTNCNTHSDNNLATAETGANQGDIALQNWVVANFVHK